MRAMGQLPFCMAIAGRRSQRPSLATLHAQTRSGWKSVKVWPRPPAFGGIAPVMRWLSCRRGRWRSSSAREPSTNATVLLYGAARPANHGPCRACA